MTPLAQEIRKQITAEGPMGFDEWMDLALYHPSLGFYSKGGQAGRRGKDFLTSPEVGPLFGAVLAQVIDSCWNELGQPDNFTVIEAGAGRGALAASVLRAKPACYDALRYVMVESSELLRDQQQETLKYVAPANNKILSLEKLPGCVSAKKVSGMKVSGMKVSGMKPTIPFGMVIANELLDNLPSRILEYTASGWKEVLVGLEKDGPNFTSLSNLSFSECLASISSEEQELATSLIHDTAVGTRIPLQTQASAWICQACELVDQGKVIIFDYGATTAELAKRGGWLRTYAKHGKGNSPLTRLGEQDITCDVAFDQLPPPARLQTQAEFLQNWGIQSHIADGQKKWHSAKPTTEALIARSRLSEAAALCDPDTFGSYKVAQWHKQGAEE